MTTPPLFWSDRLKEASAMKKYLFKDASGTVTVEIDNEDWRGLNVTPQDTVILNGEIDKEMFKDTKIDVDSIALKK